MFFKHFWGFSEIQLHTHHPELLTQTKKHIKCQWNSALRGNKVLFGTALRGKMLEKFRLSLSFWSLHPLWYGWSLCAQNQHSADKEVRGRPDEGKNEGFWRKVAEVRRHQLDLNFLTPWFTCECVYQHTSLLWVTAFRHLKTCWAVYAHRAYLPWLQTSQWNLSSPYVKSHMSFLHSVFVDFHFHVVLPFACGESSVVSYPQHGPQCGTNGNANICSGLLCSRDSIKK